MGGEGLSSGCIASERLKSEKRVLGVGTNGHIPPLNQHLPLLR